MVVIKLIKSLTQTVELVSFTIESKSSTVCSWLVYTQRSAAIFIAFLAICSAVSPSMSNNAVAAAIKIY